VVRTRDDLVDQRVAATNQLAACLEAFWPGAKQVFAELHSPIALEFLTRYPTPESAAHLGERRMAAFCTKHGYSGRRPAAQLLARLHAAPAGLCGTVEVEARRDAVLALVGVLRALNSAIKDLDRSVIAHLGEHPDAETFTSLPRSGQINAAQVLAEWGDCRPAYDGPDAVACLAGATPVTRQSGKHVQVGFRWACNKRFRQAMCTFADNSRHASPWAAGLPRRPRARLRPSPRDPHPGPRMDPGDLALLAGRGALRPGQARWRRQADRDGRFRGVRLTQGVMGSPLRSPPAPPLTDGRRGSGTTPVPCRPGPTAAPAPATGTARPRQAASADSTWGTAQCQPWS